MDSDAPAVEGDAQPSGAMPKRRNALGSWIGVIVGALVVAALLRTLVFEAYRIPSTSMEDTLLIGDFVFVSKLPVGARIMGHRLPALGSVERGDVVVFNYPPDLATSIARRTPYIKRLAGMPGDTLSLVDKELIVNHLAIVPPEASRRFWVVRLTEDGAVAAFDLQSAMGLDEALQRLGPRTWLLNASEATVAPLDTLGGVDSVEPYIRAPSDGSAAFPAALRFSLDDYGPIVVPAEGLAVPINDETWPVYRVAIERFEGHSAERSSAGFLVDGVPVKEYTFGQDYYFALGDNRDDSADSRTWGFVPRSHMIGKALLIYFSWDEPSKSVRWNRVFSPVGR